MAGVRAFYLLSAVAILTLSFLDLFDRVADGDFTRTYGSLYAMAGRFNGTVAVIGLILLYLLVLTLLALVFRGPRRGLAQFAIVAISVLAAVLLIAKPGTSDPSPRLAPAGVVLLVLSIVLALVAALDLRRTPRQPA